MLLAVSFDHLVGYRRAGVRVQDSHVIIALDGGACEASQNETVQHQPFRISTVTDTGSTGGGAIVSAVSGWVMSITTALTTAFGTKRPFRRSAKLDDSARRGATSEGGT